MALMEDVFVAMG
jgi:hypothetical protein